MAFEDTRYTVVFQKRRTADSPFGRLGDFLNWISNEDGYSVFALFGSCSKEDSFQELSGACVELTRGQYRNLKSKIRVLAKECTEEEFQRLFQELAADCAAAAQDRPGALTAIELQRSGDVTVTVDDSLVEDGAEQKLIASQAFFFLRDIAHVHQHHAPTTDTILDVTPVSDDSHAWQRETLYSLYRWVIQQKRSKSPIAYLGAKGVLAYARAFEERHCTGMPPEFPNYLNQPTVRSIEAGQELSSFLATTRSALSQRIFSQVIPLLAFVIALLTPLYSQPDGKFLTDDQLLILRFSNWFNAHIVEIITTVAASTILYNLAGPLRDRLVTNRVSLDAMRLLFKVNFFVWVLLLFTLTGVSLVIAYGLMDMAVSAAAPFETGP
ncbi:hypothetical protein [uncultured Shimia sp.]|uniref:hypothetical protein n=1 Tax=uncultured Shimia sp. TaxID=573152 RepID=UPI0026396612|nr:hypothetical protein [uncultured Shimia sp.]